jgi:ATP-binding cassette, subfamily B, bacterial MsbA
MKTFLRILRYAPNLTPRFVKFITFSLSGIIFGSVNFVMLIPLLQLLFSIKQGFVVPPKPDPTVSIEYLKNIFNYHFLTIVQSNGPMGALVFMCVILICFTIIANIFRYMERMIASRMKVDVVRNMRIDLFDKVTNQHIGFFNNKRKGDLISRFTNDIAEVEGAVVNSLKFVLKEPMTIIVTFVILFNISPKLTLFTLIVLPVTGGILAELMKRLKKKAVESQQSIGRIVNILDETFGGMRVIKAFTAKNFIMKKFADETAYHRKVNLSISRKNELAAPFSESFGVTIMAGIMYYGGSLILGETPELAGEQFIVFLVMYATLLQPAKNFSNGITSLQKGIIAGTRIFEITDAVPEVKNRPGAQQISSFNNHIEFKDVTFAYDNDPVLQHINLTIEKGKTIALVGPSGGGKSTLADMVPRFYDVKEGAVLLDGVDIRDIDLESLRKLTGVVTQESILFNDTIFNNIAFGMPNVKEEDVIQAAKVANAHDFIMQAENGYQTFIGERGSKLSGGQRQRLSIARAVLKNPPILILDEATSALDSESERLVQDALNNLMKNRTSIVIAHRLSTIQHADEIIVIRKGEIVERGSHEVLVQQKGLYRKLSEIQRTAH